MLWALLVLAAHGCNLRCRLAGSLGASHHLPGCPCGAAASRLPTALRRWPSLLHAAGAMLPADQLGSDNIKNLRDALKASSHTAARRCTREARSAALLARRRGCPLGSHLWASPCRLPSIQQFSSLAGLCWLR